ncbi:MAG: GIDE domain-containing protein [Eubacteriaceae bacterium]
MIGAIIILGGIGFAIYLYQKSVKAVAEINYQQTTCIKDVMDIIGDLGSLDENYRHYSEVKGNLKSLTGDVVGPFSERKVAYYKNTAYSVNEETRTVRDDDGNTRTVTNKVENTISSETSPVEIYISDDSSDEKVFLDLESFRGDVDLMPGCNRFEPKNSQWVQQRFNFNFSGGSGSRFLGYRFFEEILPEDQPMYILGEIHKRGDRLYVGRSIAAKKPSMVTYKSESELVADTKQQKLFAVLIGVGSLVVGAFVMLMS